MQSNLQLKGPLSTQSNVLRAKLNEIERSTTIQDEESRDIVALSRVSLEN